MQNILQNLTNFNFGFIGLLIVPILFLLGFVFTRKSLEKLDFKLNPYFPFDRFFPQAGKWSIIYYLITLVSTLLLAYLLAAGYIVLFPA